MHVLAKRIKRRKKKTKQKKDNKLNYLFVKNLGFGGTPNFLSTVLPFFSLFTWHLFDFDVSKLKKNKKLYYLQCWIFLMNDSINMPSTLGTSQNLQMC